MTKKQKGDIDMNYYGAGYPTYPYPTTSGYPSYPMPMNQQQSMPQAQQMQQMPQQQTTFPMSQQMNNQQQVAPITPGLNGKIVDSEEVARVAEVPIGGYGVFPKANMSEIYVKIWRDNGTSDFAIYRPVVPEPPVIKDNSNELTNLLLQKIDALENKIDMCLAPKAEMQPQATKKMEVTKNGF